MDQFYLRDNSSYQVIQKNNFEKIMLVVFTAFLIFFLYKGIKTDNNIPLGVFFILPVLIYTFKIGRKVKINTKAATLEIGFLFNLYTKKYNLNDFKQLLIINHKMNFINNGREVKMLFNNNEEVSLIRKDKFKNIKEFIAETEKIIKQ